MRGSLIFAIKSLNVFIKESCFCEFIVWVIPAIPMNVISAITKRTSINVKPFEARRDFLRAMWPSFEGETFRAITRIINQIRGLRLGKLLCAYVEEAAGNKSVRFYIFLSSGASS